jgi:PIN domain nuclease of toxin-antitoxin system
MTSVLADTETIIHYLLAPTRLCPVALETLSAAERTGRLFVSAITLVEVRFEIEAGRLPQGVWDRLRKAVADPRRPLTVLPVDTAVADVLDQVSPSDHPTVPGRIIAATAVAHELRVVSGAG